MKQYVVDSHFDPVRYNNCTKTVYFLFRHTSVATNINKAGPFGVGFSGIW